jgi:hypothetical protein
VVDINKKTITIQGQVFKIKGYESWWAVEGLGLFSSLEELRKEVPEDAINLINIRPVPVAVSDVPGVYETI